MTEKKHNFRIAFEDTEPNDEERFKPDVWETVIEDSESTSDIGVDAFFDEYMADPTTSAIINKTPVLDISDDVGSMYGTTSITNTAVGTNDLAFNIADQETPLLLFKENGDVLHNGILIGTDSELMGALRTFLNLPPKDK